MKRLIIKITTLIFGLLISCIAASMPSTEPVSVVENKEITFSQLGINGSISMSGSESTAFLSFGSRLDEIVSKASLQFSFVPSPALLSAVSHLKVFLNEELMGVIAINDGDQGREFQPRYL